MLAFSEMCQNTRTKHTATSGYALGYQLLEVHNHCTLVEVNR